MVLGVSRTASQDDIAKAYRKLAKRLHPDVNPGDKAAEDQFKAVSAAYQLLDDPKQRARFDRGEIDATGAEVRRQPSYRPYAEAEGSRRYTSSHGHSEGEDFSDLFSSIFGGGRRRADGMRTRGRDVRYHMNASFLDAAIGAKRRITLGDGQTVDLAIPPGASDGSILRLKGKGEPGLGGGPHGDALVVIDVAEHPVFRREGDDIIIDLPITMDEAILGAKVETPTIWGPVTLTIPKGANTGDVLRLRGKGVKATSGATGDQRVMLKIAAPDTIDQDLEAFMTRWRVNHGYDPRARLRGIT